MLRRIRRFIFITLLLIHLTVLVLWWDSWHRLRVSIFPQSTERFGVWSGSGMVVLNAWSTEKPRHTILPELWTDFITELSTQTLHWNAYFDPLSPPGPLNRRFSFEMVTVIPGRPAHGGSIPAPRIISSTPPDRYLRICFPYWFGATVSAAVVWPWVGWIAFRRRRVRRRDRAGLCPKCGYDMRANPATCSECGHASSGMIHA